MAEYTASSHDRLSNVSLPFFSSAARFVTTTDLPLNGDVESMVDPAGAVDNCGSAVMGLLSVIVPPCVSKSRVLL